MSWVSQRLQELRDELTLAAGRFFPLTPTEYDALRQSIADDGVLNPILIGEHIACLDGYHRCTISLELGLTEIPAVFVSGKSAEEEYELSLALNTARRQIRWVIITYFGRRTGAISRVILIFSGGSVRMLGWFWRLGI